MSILNVEHLSHGFGDRAIFGDVSFRLLKGEHIGLVGANGEGKSTFMNVVTGKKSKKYALPLALTLGGGYGNFLERAGKGKVTDFLYIPVEGRNAPIFNLADIAIWIGAVWLTIVSCSEN